MRHIAESHGAADETLVLSGVLRRGKLTWFGCHTTRATEAAAAAADGIHRVEVRGADDRVLSEAPLALVEPDVCSGLTPNGLFVRGRVALPPGAQRLLVFARDRLIHTTPIGDAPTIALRWEEKAVVRGRRYRLGLELSPATPDAFLKLFYQWDERRYMVAGLSRPVGHLDLDFDGLPGGERCRILVAYTSAMRTAVATTSSFQVPALAPVLRIIRPRKGAVYAPWHPVELQAEVMDRQKRGVRDRDLVWALNDKAVATGPVVCLQGLPVGDYDVELRLTGAVTGTARAAFTVAGSFPKHAIRPEVWDAVPLTPATPAPRRAKLPARSPMGR
jgi:hypothetical protein